MLPFKTGLGSLCLPQSQHLRMQTKADDESLSSPYIRCSLRAPHVWQVCGSSEFWPIVQPGKEMQQQNPALPVLFSEQDSEGRGNTITLLTCSDRCGAKKGSLEMPLHQASKKQWNFPSSSHFKPQQDKGMETSMWKPKQNLDFLSFIYLVSVHPHDAKTRPTPAAISLRDVKPQRILRQQWTPVWNASKLKKMSVSFGGPVPPIGVAMQQPPAHGW